MKKLILIIALLLVAVAVSAFTIPTFTTVQDAQDWRTNYKYPVFGTATIQSIDTTLDGDFYTVTYLLEYTNKMETMLDNNKTVDKTETEYVNMMIRKPLPADDAVESLINDHALDFFSSVINITPDPKISLVHNLIGKVIILKEPPKPEPINESELIGKL